MNRLNWTPGEHGKGIIDQHGDVHAWNEDEHETHASYMNANPAYVPHAYFYINPEGGIALTMPHKRYDPRQEYDAALQTITDTDPHFHEEADSSWQFG